ncbi:MAG: hypothetical protein SF051_07505 [Elusimicrobiota bacterium]|nr:hypothetical protein [Elusimicrobiota bacterium]
MGLERQDVQRTTPSGMTFEQFIKDVAGKAKLNVQVKGPDMIMVPWDLAEGRKQNTFVRPLGSTGVGLIVSFFSPTRKIVTGSELDLATTLELLRKNARIPHGAWAIASVLGEEYLGVQDTQIAHTMQPEEFYASALVVAKIADELEQKLGTDTY